MLSPDPVPVSHLYIIPFRKSIANDLTTLLNNTTTKTSTCTLLKSSYNETHPSWPYLRPSFVPWIWSWPVYSQNPKVAVTVISIQIPGFYHIVYKQPQITILVLQRVLFYSVLSLMAYRYLPARRPPLNLAKAECAAQYVARHHSPKTRIRTERYFEEIVYGEPEIGWAKTKSC